eukprot:jgi/Botrbrau1/2132/Bobra.0093s0039.1
MCSPSAKKSSGIPLNWLGIGLATGIVLAYFLAEWSRPTVLLVGSVTIDLVDGKQALGGAISYAAAVLSALGVRSCVVTAVGKDADLSVFEGHELHVVPATATLTFEHTYTWWGNKRKLRVTAQPNVTLTPEHVPWHCRRARILLLGPLTPQDLHSAAFVHMPQAWWDQLLGFQQHVGLMAQGLQRGLDPHGNVFAFTQPSPDLVDSLGPRTLVFLSDVETDVWTAGVLNKLAASSARWLVTRGEQGADEITASASLHLPAVEVVAEDTNGAGDTFATAYMVALARGHARPGLFANWAASRAVMVPQSCKPHCVGDRLRTSSPPSSSSFISWATSKMAKLVSGDLTRDLQSLLLRCKMAAQQYSSTASSVCTSAVGRLISKPNSVH